MLIESPMIRALGNPVTSSMGASGFARFVLFGCAKAEAIKDKPKVRQKKKKYLIESEKIYFL